MGLQPRLWLTEVLVHRYGWCIEPKGVVHPAKGAPDESICMSLMI
jgi:hypothetical protein